jgi:hypothetical protein
MLNVMGAIDDIHIAITKPFGAFVEDYYSPQDWRL